jgi:hypothetical protein
MFDKCDKMLEFPIFIFANNQIIKPAGAATQIARINTKTTFSLTLFKIVFTNCGLRSGGISITNELLCPFKTVLLKIFDEIIVTTSDKHKSASNIIAAPTLLSLKNITIIAINKGNLPLQGVKEFVIIAINRSRGESIILAPVTPTALQPIPIQQVSACLPQAPHFSKQKSKLNAIRGKIP